MKQRDERFVYGSLRRYAPEGMTVHAQNTKPFWTPDQGQKRNMRPDILLKSSDQIVVLDTKWKRPNGNGPSPDDLRQLYVYLKYYGAQKAALVYPGKGKAVNGCFAPLPGQTAEYMDRGSLLFLPVGEEVRIWQQTIKDQVEAWAGFTG